MKKKQQQVLTFIISFFTYSSVKATGLYDTAYRPNTSSYTLVESNYILGMPPYKFVIFMIGIVLLLVSIIYLIKKKEKRYYILFIPTFLIVIYGIYLLRTCGCRFNYFIIKDLIVLLLMFLIEKIYIKDTLLSYKKIKMNNPIILNTIFNINNIYLLSVLIVVSKTVVQKVFLVLELILIVLIYIYNHKRFMKLYKRKNRKVIVDE